MADVAMNKATTSYRFDRFELDSATRQLLADGQPVALGARALDVLLALIERRERLVTKDELLGLSGPTWLSRKITCRCRSPHYARPLGSKRLQRFPEEATGSPFRSQVSKRPLHLQRRRPETIWGAPRR